jgi:glycerol kinase
MMGDQQAAALGQGCFHEGDVKSTYGTGCFMLTHTGKQILPSQHRLLSTVNYQLKDQVAYGIEGSIFVAGATVQWLRDAVHMITNAKDSSALAKTVPDNGGVYLVPAFTGLGAPYWDPLARGAILGLTRDSTQAHIVRAGLEAVAYQTRDLLEAMRDDGCTINRLRVDGGMATNDWLMQFLVDILALPILRPKQVETSALGAAYLGGLTLGRYHLEHGLPAPWQAEDVFMPQLAADIREQWYQGWQEAITRIAKR